MSNRQVTTHQMMNKQELISQVASERSRLEEVIAALTPEQIIAANAIGVWSVKDVLGHLTAWTARCVTVIFHAEDNQEPEDIDAMLDSWDALNAEDHELQKDRPLELVLSDFRGSHRQLLRRLNGWNDADLFDTRRFQWLRGMSLGHFISTEVADHEADHRQQIEKWRAGQ
jgi:Protein of unknown function (DUF1706)